MNENGILFQYIEKFAGDTVEIPDVIKASERWFFGLMLSEIVGNFNVEFTTFLKSEFSYENLAFVNAVSKYRELKTPEELVSEFNGIMESFILQGAENQVNISSNLVNALIQLSSTKEKINAQSFDDADHHVRVILTQDTLIRFKESKIYKDSMIKYLENERSKLNPLPPPPSPSLGFLRKSVDVRKKN